MRMTTVWMIHARTGLEGRKGTLSLEADTLVFRPASKSFGHSVFRVADIKKVRRMRASPVLEVRLSTEEHPPVVAFYFIKPPSLTPPEDGRRRLFPKRAARKDAISHLWQGNTRKKEEIAEWQEAIERARGGRD